MQMINLNKYDSRYLNNLNGAFHICGSRQPAFGRKSLKSALSFGFIINQKLAGYILAFINKSSFNKNFPEPVIFVQDIAILPGYSAYLANFLMLFCGEIYERKINLLPIELVYEDSSQNYFLPYRNLLEIWGYELSCTSEPAITENMLLRFDPVHHKQNSSYYYRETTNKYKICSFDKKPVGPIAKEINANKMLVKETFAVKKHGEYQPN